MSDDRRQRLTELLHDRAPGLLRAIETYATTCASAATFRDPSSWNELIRRERMKMLELLASALGVEVSPLERRPEVRP